MVSVVSSNNRQSRDNRAPAPAVRSDGSNYPWRMFFDDGQRIVDADTTAEVLDYLITDYTLLDDEEKKQARIDLARSVQQLARATLLGNIDAEKAATLADWEWDVLNYGSEGATDPYGWGDGTGTLGTFDEDSESIDLWSSDIPLVLLDTTYIPYTEISTPLSSEGDFKDVKNIVWLRPTQELSLLRSLSRIGFITFGQPAPTYNGE